MPLLLYPYPTTPRLPVNIGSLGKLNPVVTGRGGDQGDGRMPLSGVCPLDFLRNSKN